MNKFLMNNWIQFHTFELLSEKPLKGIPQEISEEDVKENLGQQSYPALKITRLKGRRGLQPLLLIDIRLE